MGSLPDARQKSLTFKFLILRLSLVLKHWDNGLVGVTIALGFDPEFLATLLGNFGRADGTTKSDLVAFLLGGGAWAFGAGRRNTTDSRELPLDLPEASSCGAGVVVTGQCSDNIPINLK